MSSNKLVKIPLIFKKIEECNLSIIFELQPDSYEVELFIVGGTVRDALLNLSKNLFDLDIVVKPTEATLMITNKISDLINGSFFPLDEERQIYRIIKKGCQLDITGIRGETLIDDMFHRDFSIDALSIAFDVLKDSFNSGRDEVYISDFFGGIEDLQKRLIRAHNPESFREDPSRILRAFRLMSEIDGKIDEYTLSEIVESKTLLKTVAKERIRDEFFKILNNSNSSKIVNKLHAMGILSEFFPFIEWFNEIDKEYPEYVDLKNHSLDTLMYLEKLIKRIEKGEFAHSEKIKYVLEKEIVPEHSIKSLLKIASLLHDIGKPETLSFEGKRMRFFNHELEGSKHASNYLKELKLSGKEVEIVENLIVQHMRPHNLSSVPELTPRSMYRFFRDTGDLGIPLLFLALADAYATRKCKMGELKEYEEFVNTMIDYFFKPKEVQSKPLIDGYEIMELLALKPSPKVGEILEDLKEAQALNVVKTKEEAVNYIISKYKVE
ncbi:MAG: HD domain-containing protein [Caldisericia bacterium]|nr:HD domain-containing protein [Caldisericia bacterium]